MKDIPKFAPGDLVTYTEDLLGIQDYSGIVTAVFCDEDDIWYAVIQWLDGAEYPEMFRHIQLLVKAKDEQKQ
jgi:hypothetical protein